MQMYGQMRQEYTPEYRHGNIPGVRVGRMFRNRGELAILGLHGNINGGIYSKCAHRVHTSPEHDVLGMCAFSLLRRRGRLLV